MNFFMKCLSESKMIFYYGLLPVTSHMFPKGLNEMCLNLMYLTSSFGTYFTCKFGTLVGTDCILYMLVTSTQKHLRKKPGYSWLKDHLEWYKMVRPMAIHIVKGQINGCGYSSLAFCYPNYTLFKPF